MHIYKPEIIELLSIVEKNTKRICKRQPTLKNSPTT